MSYSAYGDGAKNSVRPQDGSVVQIAQEKGEPSAISNGISKITIGAYLQQDNPHILDREMKDVPVRASSCGDVPEEAMKGYRTVKTDFGKRIIEFN